MLFFKKEDLEVTHVDDNTDRYNMSHGGSLMYCLIVFHKACDDNEDIPLHSHMHEQMTYCMKGSFKFEVNDENGKHVDYLREGDSLYLPAHSRHGCIPLEDDSRLIDCFTPQREDYL